MATTIAIFNDEEWDHLIFALDLLGETNMEGLKLYERLQNGEGVVRIEDDDESGI